LLQGGLSLLFLGVNDREFLLCGSHTRERFLARGERFLVVRLSFLKILIRIPTSWYV